MRHFLASLLHVEGVEADIDRVYVEGREAQIGVFPMGVDAARFIELAQTPDVIAQAEAIRRDAGGRRIALGIDRLDYTKGIPRRLQAVELLLDRHPEWREGLRYIQVAVPSRGEVDSYQRFKRDVEERVGRINGQFGTLTATPIHYMHQSVTTTELVALYVAADVMLVTPLRDGMNLVAKEFVASRLDNDGVLVLSEFAGASAELDGALCVNPYDGEACAESIHRALTMSDGERRARMTALRRRVIEHDVHAWAHAFVDRLTRVTSSPPERLEPPLLSALSAARRRGPLHLLLDYDGTLVPLARSPELAAPDEEALTLLRIVAATPGLRVDLVSGRPRETLEQWVGHFPIGLWAEHGFWQRRDGDWIAATRMAPDWLDRLRPLLEQFTAATPGSQVEIKSACCS
jgi:trehalose 6-phosphate synthase/phosphatase